jgi:SPP1 family predicted phage head-tail adaptor
MSVQALVDKYGVLASIRRKNAAGTDAVGGMTESWAFAVDTKVMFQIRNGSEGMSAGAERDASQATIYIPGSSAVEVQDRIFYSGTFWEITSVRVPDERPSTDALCYTIVEARRVFS